MEKALLKTITGIYILIFLVIIAIAKATGKTGFILDSVGFIFMTLVFYFLYDKLRMNVPIFTMLIFGLVLHNLGVFGFYGESPICVPWDYVTHFFPIMFVSIMFFNYLYQYMDKRFFSSKTVIMIIIVLLASLGIGSLIENWEYAGFSMMGFGEGALQFGMGDGFEGQAVATIEEIEAYGGGWFNTMHDLVNNLLGAILGIIIMSFAYFGFKRE